jgi:uncharacterized membrane protein
MYRTILGVYDDTDNAEDAINQLREDGLNPKDISIVMKNKKEGEELASNTGADVAGGAVSGATTGAIIGGIAGLLAAIAIPGLGAFLIGGPIAAALGLGGAAASTVSGAATGAVAGGLLGALTGLGLSDDEAREYEESVKSGAILVAVPATDRNEARVREVLEATDAQKIRSVAMPESARTHLSHSDDNRGWYGDSWDHADAARGEHPRH